MSGLDVSETAPELGRPPMDRPAGPSTATTCAGLRTATTPGRSVGRRRPARRAPSRPTSGAGCTRDRAEHRRPYGEPSAGLPVDRDLIDDLAVRGGHDDVRRLHAKTTPYPGDIDLAQRQSGSLRGRPAMRSPTNNSMLAARTATSNNVCCWSGRGCGIRLITSQPRSPGADRVAG